MNVVCECGVGVWCGSVVWECGVGVLCNLFNHKKIMTLEEIFVSWVSAW